jgi:tetratricopeptide (TPR) repeat protein
MKLPKLKKIISVNNGLRVILLAGLMLFSLACITLTVFYFIERSNSRISRKEDNFYRIMREYDISYDIYTGTERELERLGRELDRLEKVAIGVDTWLSVLKRRKALSVRHPPSLENYRASIGRAQKLYPSSQPIAAIAASAIIKDRALNEEAEAELRAVLAGINDPAFNKLRLSLHVLLGDFKNPGTALGLPLGITTDGTEFITQDLIILKVLRADYNRAGVDILSLLYSSEHRPSTGFIRFCGEYYYDFGELVQSARLFSLLDDDEAMIRQADALYLAGYPDSARSLWNILSENSDNTPLERSFYNLAVTAEDPQQAILYLEKLNDLDTVSNIESRQAGLIRYTRLLDYNRAVNILENTEALKPSLFPYVDLEICKRKSGTMQPARQVAEAWLLLDRHYDNEDLYRWAAWQMAFQRSFSELNILLDRIELNNQFKSWAPFYRAVFLMQEGSLENAESILRGIPAESSGWLVFANSGRIQEAYRNLNRAIEQYELASAIAPNGKAASKLYVRMARCLSALGRVIEAYTALETALELDPENLSAALELDRFLR